MLYYNMLSMYLLCFEYFTGLTVWFVVLMYFSPPLIHDRISALDSILVPSKAAV